MRRAVKKQEEDKEKKKENEKEESVTDKKREYNDSGVYLEERELYFLPRFALA